MTTSSDTTFDCSRDDVIDDALAAVGAIGPGDTAEGSMRDHAARALNKVVKAIDADGKFLWRSIRRTQSLTAGTSSYTLAADVIGVDEPLTFKRAASNTRTPVRFMSSDDYFANTSDRTIRGVPSQFTVETALPTTFTIHLWPAPDTTADIIEYRAMIRGLDYDTGANTGDFPSRWAMTLQLGLEVAVGPAYGMTSSEVRARMQMFIAEKERQLNASGEEGPLYLVPWGNG